MSKYNRGNFIIIVDQMNKQSILLLLVLLVQLSSSEVDTLNILLPEVTLKDLYLPMQLVTAKSGCYQWRSSSPDTLLVESYEPNVTKCSKKGLIKLNHVGPFSSSIYVTAEDIETQDMFNIPVRIRKISKISIMTKSRMMNIKEVQKIQLLGHDEADNTFTSLEGLKFEWTLVQSSKILEKVEISQASLYLPLKIRETIERKGFETDILVVRALSPGNLLVKVRCLQKGYEKVTAEITISVHQRFEIHPSGALKMLIGSSYQFGLKTPYGLNINLPQEYYRISIDQNFHSNKTLFTKLPNKKMMTDLKVEDVRTKPPYSSQTTIYVQQPDEIILHIDQYIIVGQNYEVKVDLLYKKDILLGYSDEIVFQSDFLFDKKGMVVKSVRKMVGYVSVRFRNLVVRKEVTAYLPLKLLVPEKELVLPVDEVYSVLGVGGSKSYDYQLTNPELATISHTGTLTTKQIGKCTLIVSDRKDKRNKATISLRIQNVKSINSLQEQKQLNQNEFGNLYVIGRTGSGQTFSQCFGVKSVIGVGKYQYFVEKKIDFGRVFGQLRTVAKESQIVGEVVNRTSRMKGRQREYQNEFKKYVDAGEMSNAQLLNHISTLENYGICDIQTLKHHTPHTDRLYITLKSAPQIQTNIPIRVYAPLTTIIHHENEQFLMTPLSSLKWLCEGGSYGWGTSQRYVKINDALVDGDSAVVWCGDKESKGEYFLEVGNVRDSGLLFPVKQVQSILVRCLFPKKLEHQFEKQSPSKQVLYLYPNTKVIGFVYPTDQNGKTYYNSSNLLYKPSAQKGHLQQKIQNFTYINSFKTGTDYITVTTSSLTPTGQKFPQISTKFETHHEKPLDIKHVMNDTQVVTLMSPQKPYYIDIGNGNQYVQVYCGEDAVRCDGYRKGESVGVRFVDIGEGVVRIRNRRVYGVDDYNIKFKVVEPESIEIVLDRDITQINEEFAVHLICYHSNLPINPHLYDEKNLRLHLPSSLQQVSHSNNTFVLQGVIDGKFNIVGENSYPRVMKSRGVQIYVYPKIEVNVQVEEEKGVGIYKGQSWVVEGCSKVLRFMGGPQGMKVEFEGDNANLKVTQPAATVPVFHLQALKTGQTSLQFFLTHKQMFLSTYKLKIHISKLEQLQLNHIKNPLVGSQFRIWPVFKIDYGEIHGCVCEFQYEWGVSNSQVLKVWQGSSLGNLEAGGVNATGVGVGNSEVWLRVKDKSSNKIIKETRKSIGISPHIATPLPIFISSKPAPATPLLLPPNSGLDLSTITSYSPTILEIRSDCKFILTQKNKTYIQTSNDYSTLLIKLKDQNSNYYEYMQIEIVDVEGLFIQNNGGVVVMDRSQERFVQFYVQDRFGRVVHNYVEGFKFTVRSSNPEVLSARVVKTHPSKNQIKLHPKAEGISVITLELEGYSLRDIVPVMVGNEVLPTSPVNVLQGGIVNFESKSGEGGWSTSDEKISAINKVSGQFKAFRVGKVQVLLKGVRTRVNILPIEAVEEMGGVVVLNSRQIQLEYMLMWKVNNQLKRIANLNSNSPHIKNNLDISIEVSPGHLFKVSSQKILEDRISCIINLIDFKDQKELKLKVSLTNNQKNEKIQEFAYVVKREDMEGRVRYLELSESDPFGKVQFDTFEEMDVTVVKGMKQWVQSSYAEGEHLQIVEIDMVGVKEPTELVIEITNKARTIEEAIKVVYKLSESKKEDKKKGKSIFSWDMDWPDYLILIMGIIFGAICVCQCVMEKKSSRM